MGDNLGNIIECCILLGFEIKFSSSGAFYNVTLTNEAGKSNTQSIPQKRLSDILYMKAVINFQHSKLNEPETINQCQV